MIKLERKSKEKKNSKKFKNLSQTIGGDGEEEEQWTKKKKKEKFKFSSFFFHKVDDGKNKQKRSKRKKKERKNDTVSKIFWALEFEKFYPSNLFFFCPRF